MNKALFQTGKDDWETPRKLFEELDREFHFTLDPCCSHENAKCGKHYTEAENGLAQNWGGETVFVNPPYSRQGKQDEWVKKCWEEAQKPGTVVVALLPARTDTERFHAYILGQAEIRFIRGRLRFEQNGMPGGTATFPSMICIWRGTEKT